MDVPTYRTLEMLGAAFQDEPIHGLLLLSAKPDRMSLGAQLVAALMGLSFSNPDKWSSVVLVGTKNDKYDENDEQNFLTDVLCTFNDLVNGSITKVCTCNHKDISAVEDMIERLSGEAGVGAFTTPAPEKIADVFCNLNGLPEGTIGRDEQMAAIMEQIRIDRETLREELRAAREDASRQQQMYDQQMQELHRQHELAQQQANEMIGQLREDAENRRKELEQQIAVAANSQKTGFRISLWPPEIRF